jgi:hypothetical protein
VDVGIKGGVPVTSPFDYGANSSSKPYISYSSKTKFYTVGPMVELRVLPFGLALEADVLYKRLNYDALSRYSSSSFFDFLDYRAVATSLWNVSTLAKHRLKTQVLQGVPYIGAGINFTQIGRTTTKENSATVSILIPTPFVVTTAPVSRATPVEVHSRTRSGLTLQTGIEWRRRMIVAPEVRYTRAFGRNFEYYCAEIPPLLCSNVNQVEITIGIGYQVRKTR